MIEEFDVVALKAPLPAYDLVEGDKGAVVDIYRDYDTYTVEFMRAERTVAIVDVHAEDVRIVWKATTAAYAD